MKKRFHVWIYGLVKGVFFRATIKEEADKLGLKGFVRNTEDCVELVLEGESERVQQMLEFCRKGPKYAKVVKTEEKEENYAAEFPNFKILHF
ncbi:MAG: acylphosphatase [archaeon]